jgi:hypothetical protein
MAHPGDPLLPCSGTWTYNTAWVVFIGSNSALPGEYTSFAITILILMSGRDLYTSGPLLFFSVLLLVLQLPSCEDGLLIGPSSMGGTRPRSLFKPIISYAIVDLL